MIRIYSIRNLTMVIQSEYFGFDPDSMRGVWSGGFPERHCMPPNWKTRRIMYSYRLPKQPDAATASKLSEDARLKLEQLAQRVARLSMLSSNPSRFSEERSSISNALKNLARRW
jgi:hypothetical protein